MKIKRENLLVVAGVFWLIAGVNVLKIGIDGLVTLRRIRALWLMLALLGACVIFLGFHVMFSKMVRRYTARIVAMESARQNPLNFFDARGYAIMAVMMTGGFGLRIGGLIPDWFVAFFYTGLGCALALAGMGFLVHRAKGRDWTFHKRGPGAAYAAKADAQIAEQMAKKAGKAAGTDKTQ